VIAGDARAQLAATAVFLGSVLLVASHAPPWTVAVAFGCGVWRVLLALGWLTAPRPRKGMRFLFGALTAVLVGGVLLSFRTLNGLAAGTALLVLMGALKLLESRARRDDGIVIGVSLFMLLAAALANQSLARLPLYLLLLWAACAAMMMVAHPGTALPVRAALRLSARALAMALPLMVVCFLFFPRFGGQFWALPGGGEASTGLSDEMSPGAIDKLVADYEPAFRVRFEGPVPPPEMRYWRGPVLNTFDGYTWRRERRNQSASPVERLGEAVRYRITLEPTHRNWLYSLDTVDGSPRRGVYVTHDNMLVRSDPVDETLSYDASSHLRTRPLSALSTLNRRYETVLAEGRNPRAHALARELRAQSADDAAYSRRVLDWFRDNGLEYTLEPDLTGLESVDSVLFDTRRGFCGHFASAYAHMMRAAGIPARVVTGYLGGEWNPVGGYLIVRQSDAHAWTEVWLDGQGWSRIDPTVVVEPERLRAGVYDVLGEANAPVAVSLQRNAWLAQLARMWDGTNLWWRERVLEFNLRSQLSFLRDLGIDSPGWTHLAWGFTGALLLWLVWVTTTLRRSVARVKPDRIARAWLKATRKLERVAPAREPAEAALNYARRVADSHPPVAGEVLALASLYTRLRFGPEPAESEIAELERGVSRLAA
jgi:transglutaminase-like putative cysteine protease